MDCQLLNRNDVCISLSQKRSSISPSMVEDGVKQDCPTDTRSLSSPSSSSASSPPMIIDTNSMKPPPPPPSADKHRNNGSSSCTESSNVTVTLSGNNKHIKRHLNPFSATGKPDSRQVVFSDKVVSHSPPPSGQEPRESVTISSCNTERRKRKLSHPLQYPTQKRRYHEESDSGSTSYNEGENEQHPGKSSSKSEEENQMKSSSSPPFSSVEAPTTTTAAVSTNAAAAAADGATGAPKSADRRL